MTWLLILAPAAVLAVMLTLIVAVDVAARLVRRLAASDALDGGGDGT